MKIRRQHISAITFCLYILAVGIICFTRPENIPSITFDWFGLPVDKMIHCLMFVPFPILSYMTLVPERYGWLAKTGCIIAIALFGAGISYMTEIVQSMLGYRSFEIKDFVADLAGICFGSVIISAAIAIKSINK